VPVLAERRPVGAEVEVRNAIVLAERADHVHVVVLEHHREEKDMDVTAPRVVCGATFGGNRLARDGRIDVAPPASVLDADKHGRHVGYLDYVLVILPVEEVEPRHSVQLHPRHELVPVGRAWLGRYEQEEAVFRESRENVREAVKHAGFREFFVSEPSPLELEELLGAVRTHQLHERSVRTVCDRPHYGLGGHGVLRWLSGYTQFRFRNSMCLLKPEKII